MTTRKILLWGLPALIFASLFTPFCIEKSYQNRRQAGWTTYQISSGTNSGRILVDGQDGIWFIAKHPLKTDIYYFNGETWTNLGSPLNIYLAVDREGQIWRLTEEIVFKQNHTSNLEVAEFTNGNWVNHNTVVSQKLHKNFYSTHSFLLDGQGRVWVAFSWQDEGGMKEPGVSVLDGQKWTTNTRYNSDLAGAGMVTAITFDPQDRAWIATARSTASTLENVSVFDGQSWIHYTAKDFGLSNVFAITTIVFDGNGDAWLGTGNGLIIYEGDEWTVYNLSDQCSFIPCHLEIAFDHRGRTWIASGKAVSVFDGEVWITLTPENSGLAGSGNFEVAADHVGPTITLSPIKRTTEPVIFEATVDHEGHIWFGTDRGINLLISDEIKAISPIWVTLRNYLNRGVNWYVPFILISLWLAAVLNVLRGVGLGVGLGLLSGLLSVTLFHFNELFIFYFLSPLVLSTVGGITGGLIGGIFDRRRGKTNLTVHFAIAGAIIGFLPGFVLILFASMG